MQFGESAKSYFSLPDDSWVVTSPATVIGQWLQEYNTGQFQRTASELKLRLPWLLATPVFFCVSRRTLIASAWDDFTRLWDCYLELHDDCPIVVPEQNGPREALVFTPLGDIRCVGQRSGSPA
jgi:hypothetical protein